MPRPFAATLNRTQLEFARKVEAAGLASFSQAVKAMERQDTPTIAKWQAQLETAGGIRFGQIPGSRQ